MRSLWNERAAFSVSGVACGRMARVAQSSQHLGSEGRCEGFVQLSNLLRSLGPTSWTLAQCRCIHIATGHGFKYPCPVLEGQLVCQNEARACSGVVGQE